MKLLRDILGRTRQSGSEGLRVFNIWLKTYVESLGHAVAVDGYGNLWVVTDSVHLPYRYGASRSEDVDAGFGT